MRCTHLSPQITGAGNHPENPKILQILIQTIISATTYTKCELGGHPPRRQKKRKVNSNHKEMETLLA